MTRAGWEQLPLEIYSNGQDLMIVGPPPGCWIMGGTVAGERGSGVEEDATMKSPAITVTGADERTYIPDLVRLTRLSPRVEIGLLWTETPEGRKRYPNREWLERATDILGERCAIHVCGRGARAAALQRPGWVCRAGRVQINGAVETPELFELCRPGGYSWIITQRRAGYPDLRNANPGHRDTPRFSAATHALLMDASGGQGLSPAEWTRAHTWKPVGFAGGLGPDNLAVELPRIMAVARGAWWIDMEGRLRDDDDWFSIKRAEQAIEIFLGMTE